MTGTPALFDNADLLAETIVREVGTNIVLALPLGLGKAIHVANALYARAAADRSIRLKIFTALSADSSSRQWSACSALIPISPTRTRCANAGCHRTSK
jgi:hypothetical protein